MLPNLDEVGLKRTWGRGGKAGWESGAPHLYVLHVFWRRAQHMSWGPWSPLHTVRKSNNIKSKSKSNHNKSNSDSKIKSEVGGSGGSRMWGHVGVELRFNSSGHIR